MEMIVSKWNWDCVKDGMMDKLQFFKEADLHHVFGDEPWKYVTRVRIEEIGGGVADSEQDRGETD